MKKIKIILLVRDCDSSRIVYSFLSNFYTIEKIVVEENISRLKQFKKRIRLIGIFKAIGQIAFMLFVFPFIKLLSQKRKNEILKQNGLMNSDLPEDKMIRVKSLNSETTRKLLSEMQPDLIIVNGTRIISKKTLNSVDAPFINIHTGITPAFRGVHGGYWAIAKGNKKLFGATIHYVDPGVDTGGIIEQVFTEPMSTDNFYTYPYLQYAAALPAMKSVVQMFSEGERPVEKQPVVTESFLWYHPTIFQWLANIKRTFILIPSLPAFLLF